MLTLLILSIVGILIGCIVMWYAAPIIIDDNGNFAKWLIRCNIVLCAAIVLVALGGYLLSHCKHNSFIITLGVYFGLLGFTVGLWGVLMLIAVSVGRFRKERL